jgi:hypothetical protein
VGPPQNLMGRRVSPLPQAPLPLCKKNWKWRETYLPPRPRKASERAGAVFRFDYGLLAGLPTPVMARLTALSIPYLRNANVAWRITVCRWFE